MKYYNQTEVPKIRFTPREVSDLLDVPYYMVWQLSNRAGLRRNKNEKLHYTVDEIQTMKKLL